MKIPFAFLIAVLSSLTLALPQATDPTEGTAGYLHKVVWGGSFSIRHGRCPVHRFAYRAVQALRRTYHDQNMNSLVTTFAYSTVGKACKTSLIEEVYTYKNEDWKLIVFPRDCEVEVEVPEQNRGKVCREKNNYCDWSWQWDGLEDCKMTPKSVGYVSVSWWHPVFTCS